MKRILLALSALAIGTAAASAADLAPKYTKAPPAPPPPPCIWCGFYIGLNGGWAGANNGNNNNNLSAISLDAGGNTGPVFATNNNNNNNLGFAGGQIGYNWMFPGGYGGAGYGGPGYAGGAAGWLVGVEADIQGAFSSNNNNNLAGTFFFGDDGNGNLFAGNSRVSWFGTLRGRVGYATGPVLFYGTGGLAYGSVRNNLLASFQDDLGDCLAGVTAPVCGASTLVSNNNTRWGWVAGAGIEWMFLPNWSAKFEYQYIDLGSVTNIASALINDTGSDGIEGLVATQHVNERFSTVRVGVNYHFGGPAMGGY
jgi:outer membrane immunogenic protein